MQWIEWKQGRIQGGHMSYAPPPLGPEATQACQGHHRLIRGTTGLAGALQNFQETPYIYLSGPPQACQGHHLSSRGTTNLQRYHGVVRGTTVPSRGISAPQDCQGHHRLIRGTTGLAGAPLNFQRAPQYVRTNDDVYLYVSENLRIENFGRQYYDQGKLPQISKDGLPTHFTFFIQSNAESVISL